METAVTARHPHPPGVWWTLRPGGAWERGVQVWWTERWVWKETHVEGDDGSKRRGWEDRAEGSEMRWEFIRSVFMKWEFVEKEIKKLEAPSWEESMEEDEEERKERKFVVQKRLHVERWLYTREPHWIKKKGQIYRGVWKKGGWVW